jgi:hypothetical protein
MGGERWLAYQQNQQLNHYQVILNITKGGEKSGDF